ncbi:putative alpha-galactosyltransferase [Synechococcus sp. MVIR-18-1]|nr:putative alpha-galactosyltransferase [Synechococcus sp. MVIR-18-1]
MNLFPPTLYPSSNTVRFDSTQISNPPPHFLVRLALSFLKVFRFTFLIYKCRPQYVCILFTSGSSLLEKTLFVLVARLFSSNSRIILFPRSDVVLSQLSCNFFLRYSFALLLRIANGWVLQSPSFINKFPVLDAPSTFISPNSIDSGLYPYSLSSLVLAKQKSLGFSILFVGWLEPVKQVDLIFYGIRHFMNKHANCDIEFNIIGDGSCRHDLEHLATKLCINTIFHGWVSDKNLLSRIYSESSCFCLASRQEGFPNVVLEALIHNLPVLSTQVGALPYFFDDNRHIIFFHSSPDSLSRSIEKIYFDSDFYKLLQVNSRRLISDFSPTVTSSKVKGFIDSIS